MATEDVEEILDLLEDLKEDMSTPKNVRNKADHIINLLRGDGDTSINASKAISIFEELSDDSNIEAITRTQIWNIISMLEKFT